MPLTPQEQAELDAINAELGQAQPVGLTPQEQAELDAINIELSTTRLEATGAEKAEAALTGFGETATFGFLPQIQAGVEQVVESLTPKDDVTKELEEKGFKIRETGDGFVSKRDRAIRRIERLEKLAPTASTIGSVAGALVSPAPGVGAAKSIPGLSKAVKAISKSKLASAGVAGGITGAIQNPGDTEGVVDPFQLSERAKNAALGFLTGGAGQAVIGGAGKALNAFVKTPQAIKGFAEMRALKSSGAMLKDFRKLAGKAKENKVGRFLLDKNIVEAGDSLEDILKKSEALKQANGQTIGDIYRKATEKLSDLNFVKGLSAGKRKALEETVIDAEKIANNLRKKITNKLKGKAGSETVLNRINKELDTLAENGSDVNLQDLREIRQSFDELVNWSKQVGELGSLQQSFVTIREGLKEAAEKRLKSLDDVLDADDLSRLRNANENYSILADITKISKDRIQRDNANRYFSLGDRVTAASGGAIAAASGNPEEAIKNGLTGLLLGAAAGRVGRTVGGPAAAKAADKLGKLLQKPANFLRFGQPIIDKASNNPEQLGIFLQQLSLDPEFKEILDEAKK